MKTILAVAQTPKVASSCPRIGLTKRILCSAALFAVAGLQPLAGTCTVAIGTRDFGILAADSIETGPAGSSRSAACKVLTRNGQAVTLAGLVLDGNTGLDLVSIATAAISELDSPRNSADRFAATAIPEIARSLERQRIEAAKMWQNRLGGVLARAVFAGVEAGQSVIVVRSLGVSPEGLVEDLGSQVIVSESKPRVLAFCDKAAVLMRSDPYWKGLDPGQLAYGLVNAAVATGDGRRVGKAVDASVVRVGKNVVEWLNRGACSEEAGRAKARPAERASSPSSKRSEPR